LKVPQLAGPVKKPKNGWKTIRHFLAVAITSLREFSFSTWIAATSSEPFQEGLLEASQQAMVNLLNSLDRVAKAAPVGLHWHCGIVAHSLPRL
jgi:hypothetical protein